LFFNHAWSLWSISSSFFLIDNENFFIFSNITRNKLILRHNIQEKIKRTRKIFNFNLEKQFSLKTREFFHKKIFLGRDTQDIEAVITVGIIPIVRAAVQSLSY
jgi:hypothetical protein